MISYQNVVKTYSSSEQSIKAVDDVTLDVEKGNLVIFLGPSGCGKTTLLRLTNRLEGLTNGKIEVDGKDIASVDDVRLRQSIGYVIQQIGLFPNKTIGENVGIIPKLLKWKKDRVRARVEELLRMVNLDPNTYIDRYPAEISGGQQQRVGVARALGADPDVLLMDEPFGAIDPINREQIQNTFLMLQEKLKKTVIFVSHDIHEAIKMADKIAIFNKGKLVQYDTPVSILTKPENSFVANFVGADSSLKVLGLMKAKDVMNKSSKNKLIPADLPAHEALKILEERKVSYLIIQKHGKLLGYVTGRDLKYERSNVEYLAEPFSVTIQERDTLRDVLSDMLMNESAYYPVLNDDGDITGTISYKNIQEQVQDIYSDTSDSDDLDSD